MFPRTCTSCRDILSARSRIAQPDTILVASDARTALHSIPYILATFSLSPSLGLPPSAARFCFVLSFFLRFPCIAAKLFNITIDDSGKDPVTGALIQYLPNSTFWHPSAEACSVCTAHPDPTQASDGTWHDSSYNPVMGNTVTYAYVPFTGAS